MYRHEIEAVRARRIFDSRGYPTVEATVLLKNGLTGTASVPSGASTGTHEAYELRDGGGDYCGKDVSKAVSNVNAAISRILRGKNAADQQSVDRALIDGDGTENKSNLGANAILAVSLANARAAANSYKLPLFRYLGGANANRLPTPMMNILNGGAHAANPLDVQEFMIVPQAFETFGESMKAGVEIYHTLKGILKRQGLSVAVGDEGGFAPELSDSESALDLIMQAVTDAGYAGKVRLALDAAASEWTASNDGAAVNLNLKYVMPKSKRAFDSDTLTDYFERLAAKYPIASIEDALGEDDYHGWKQLTERIGGKVDLVGDDFFVTNPKRLRYGITHSCANAVLVKVNQIGTLTEATDVTQIARDNGYRVIISHRSGETADTAISDIAVAVGADGIKTGAPCRSERTEKYNRLLKIEEMLSAPEFGSRRLVEL